MHFCEAEWWLGLEWVWSGGRHWLGCGQDSRYGIRIPQFNNGELRGTWRSA